jgi:hypothetical protein
MSTRLFFGGLIAIVLLILYAYATVYSILAAHCIGSGPCTDYSPNLTEGVVTVLNLVGGLVSALVISQLAITKPLDSPGAALVETTASDTVKNGVKIVSIIYVAVWVACGLAALIVGLMKYPEAVPLLNAAAKTWLGLAVAAAYSYLGLKPA